ncbi:hypothetical protein [Dethiothermospora halolimnae]|uniref:hypothetical protein n=1 Tax=Dethiothermospora halolimnae TaxID=3114390 RepID=UPI003CCB89FD
MKDKIYESINKIENLKDRALLKEILNDVFIPLYEHSSDMYKKLENRVFDEIEYIQQNYSICTTIMKKRDYDPIHYFLHPMIDTDIGDKKYDLNEIENLMMENNEIKLFKVFIKRDALTINQLLKSNRRFQGSIKTSEKIYKACFQIKKNKEYLNKIYSLYQMFIKNNIPWRTINAPYIYKMIDVYLVEYEGEFTKDESIEEINVNFQELSKDVLYDMVPVWNIEKLKLKTIGFPNPCEDKINYEHAIELNKENYNNGYLVYYENEVVKDIRRTKDQLIITTDIEESRDWDVFKVLGLKKSKTDRYEYDLMTNGKYISFMEKLANKYESNIKTKAELTRVINSFKASEDLEMVGIKIIDKDKVTKEETYNMNFFIIDEIRDFEYKKTLVLYFKCNKEINFITRDIMSFLVSEIQKFYPEYKCEGRLV